MLNWIKAGIVGIVIGVLGYFHYNAVEEAKDEVNKSWIAKQLEKDIERKATENRIRDEALVLEREKNEEIYKLNSVVVDLRNRLRNRPSRETVVYRESPGDTKACTGAELYKEDGEFLIGEAARAEKVLIERNYYYEQYEQVRKKLDERNQSE